jgi:UDP-N-acetylmuramoylalanine--D-glutamate ligase
MEGGEMSVSSALCFYIYFHYYVRMQNDFESYFTGKKVTVMGLGLLGRGVGDAAYLAEAGAEIIVTDLKSKEELAPSIAQLADFPNIQFVLGEHRFEDFENRDFILVAAGVPFDSPYLVHAKEQGIALEMSAAIFARVSQIPIIGVTGTRGKSTVTHMIHHVLSVITGEPVLLGGNIRGVSNLQLLKKVKEDSIAVFELDSWQLQGFGWAEISPQIAVFTNFMEDHQNYYRHNMDTYFLDKANIFLYQEDQDTFITTLEVFERAKKCAFKKDITLGQEVVLADSSVLPEELLLRVPGEHNRANAGLAYQALQALSLTDEEIIDGLATFPGVGGRLEYLRDINGIAVYNDNNATTPEATIVGIEAVGDDAQKNIVLIMGGADKGNDYTQLLNVIEAYCKTVILLPGTGTDALKPLLKFKGPTPKCIEVDTLSEAVETGLNASERGDVLLFSPAFASFGMFKNEYERNDEFVKLITAYE